jgi:glycosyltransferase involved in cell wall biosynthesis
VLVVTNVPAPYRLELFSRVWSEFTGFEVAFQSRKDPGRNWETAPILPYPTQYLPGFTIPLPGRRIQVNAGLASLLRKSAPDIVIACGFSPTIAVVARFCGSRGIPLILMNDGTPLTDSLEGIEALYRRWLVRHSSGFIAASQASRDYFVRLGADKDRVTVVQLTTDLQQIQARSVDGISRSRGRKRWGLGKNVMCFVGQLVGRKRPLDVLEAYAEASKCVDDLWLVMAGSGDLERALRREIEHRKLERVRLVGLLPWDEMLDLYAASDIHLFPSVREPYGMVIIESLAAGVPVIATEEAGAAVDLIEDGTNGFLVRPRDTGGMARHIETFFSSREKAEGMRRAAFQIVANHDVRIEAKRFVGAIKHLAVAASPTTVPSKTGSSSSPRRSGSPRLVYVTRTLAPYRLPLFRRLREESIEAHIVVAGGAVMGVPDSSDDAEQEGLLAGRLPPGFRWRRDVIEVCERISPDVLLIEHGARLDFAWTLLATRRIPEAKRVLWTHGIDSRELYSGLPNIGTLGRWMQLVMAEGILCYDTETAKQLSRRFPRKMIGAAPNSTDGTPILAARRALLEEGRTEIKRRRGLAHRFYLAGLGRMMPDKHLHRLPGILTRVRAQVQDVGLLFIGDGPQRRRIERVASALGLEEGRDYRVLGDVRDPLDLTAWLVCSDLVVNPGYMGLAATDALFAGVPVVLTHAGTGGPFHSPEWKYLRGNKGGIFARDRSDQAFADAVVTHLVLPERERQAIREACVHHAEEHLGIEPMVRGILQLLPQGRQASAAPEAALA